MGAHDAITSIKMIKIMSSLFRPVLSLFIAFEPPEILNLNPVKAGHSIFAHSRPDKIGTPRLLPLYIKNILNGLSAKKSAQILYPSYLLFYWLKIKVKFHHKKVITFSTLKTFCII
jgi:hypothetical protein